MSDQDRVHLFNTWADHYDRSLQEAVDFPFDGYTQVLDTIVTLSSIQPGMRVLDIGTGSGNVAARFVAHGAAVWGTDFSPAMLVTAQTRVPQATFVQADVLGPWPDQLPQCFDRIVSAYVLHEFDLATKVTLLHRLAQDHLAAQGRMIIADIAFPTAHVRAQARQRWGDRWDEQEHYWAADEAVVACAAVGLQATYQQVSSCGGVFVMSPMH